MMNQKIFKQIRCEWRSNVWLCVELLVVSVVLWFVVDFLYVKATLALRPLGFDIENVFSIETTQLSDEAIEFVAGKTNDDKMADKLTLLERLKMRPDVEAASLSSGAQPYTGNNSWCMLTIDTISAGCLVRRATPDFVKVFRYEGIDNMSADSLSEILRKGKALLCEIAYPNPGNNSYNDLRTKIGATIYPFGENGETSEIGGVYKTVSLNDFSTEGNNRSIVIPLDKESYGYANEFSVRVLPGKEKDFAESIMKAAGNELKVGNLRVIGVKTMSEMRETNLASDAIDIRNYLIGMAFLLLNIFLGLLGTFWFRTQQRTGDIAIRKVSGATRADIFRLLLAEGLLLLTVVTPVALLVDFNIAHLELNEWMEGYFAWPRFLACGAITYGLMALMIVLGVTFPARRAMHIAPAEALRDE